MSGPIAQFRGIPQRRADELLLPVRKLQALPQSECRAGRATVDAEYSIRDEGNGHRFGSSDWFVFISLFFLKKKVFLSNLVFSRHLLGCV